MRRFSLRNPLFDVPAAGGLVFGWARVPDMVVAKQLAYQEQFLSFFRY